MEIHRGAVIAVNYFVKEIIVHAKHRIEMWEI
jgi:hypothetical protein